jgi:hypothetical protein
MKEAFDDEKFYTPDQDFGSIGVTNCKAVLEKYNYDRYVQRFRLLASAHRLEASQRPKLNKEEFEKLVTKLRYVFVRDGERRFLTNEKSVKLASKLLVWSLIDEDYCGMGYTNWITTKKGTY